MVVKSLDKYSRKRLARLYKITATAEYEELARFLTSEAFLILARNLPSYNTTDLGKTAAYAAGIKDAASMLRGLQKRILPRLKGVELS